MTNTPEIQIAAANHRITLLKYAGRWDWDPQIPAQMLSVDERAVIEAHARGEGQIDIDHGSALCEMIEDAGGTRYLDNMFEQHKTAECAELYAWWLRHGKAHRKTIAVKTLASVQSHFTRVIKQLIDADIDIEPYVQSLRDVCYKMNGTLSLEGHTLDAGVEGMLNDQIAKQGRPRAA